MIENFFQKKFQKSKQDLLFPTLIIKGGSTKTKNIFVENKKKGFDFYVFCFFISRPYSSLVLPMVPNTGATYGGYPEPTYSNPKIKIF